MSRLVCAIAIPIVFISLLQSCQNDLVEEKRFEQEKRIKSYLDRNKLDYSDQNGVFHAVKIPGYGYRIQHGDTVAFWYAGYTLDNYVFSTNIYKIASDFKLDTVNGSFEPIEFEMGSGMLIEGLDRGIPMCRGGEVASILFPSDYGFGSNRMGPVPEWTPLAYDVAIISVSNPSIRKEIAAISSLLLAQDEFFTRDTTWGIWHTIPSDGKKPALLDSIYGWYRGYSIHGDVFQASPTVGEKIILNPNDSLRVLPDGLIYAFTLFAERDSGMVILPSPLAFGVEGSDDIDPYSPVLYELRIDSILK